MGFLFMGCMKEKKCKRCGVEKILDDFENDRSKKDLHRAQCRECEREKRKVRYQKNKDKNQKTAREYRKNNKEKISKRGRKKYLKNKELFSKRNKKYREKNIDKINQKQKEYALKNKAKISTGRKKYAEKNKSKIISYQKEYNIKNKKEVTIKKRSYYLRNREKFLAYRKEYAEKNRDNINKHTRKRYSADIRFKIANNLRRKLSNIIRSAKAKKAADTFLILGCDINFFIKHIENQFLQGMSWSNHGKFGWHLDHIRPISSFDIIDHEQQKKCFHYTNLQPLWAFDNLSKGSFYKGSWNNKGYKNG